MSLVAMKLANFDDGHFLAAAEEKFREVQEKLARYVQKHDLKAVGAKATLTLKITLAVEPTKDPSLRADIETKVPADPPHLRMGQFGQDEHGPCVKVNHAVDYGDPRQKRLFTPDGRPVDPTTGEIKDSGDQNPEPQSPGPQA
jgi:hypothetical protein